jgi:MbtH protein
MSENGTGPDHFVVVVNDEEQYSIWPQGMEIPAGWRAEGTAGTKEECLDHVEQVWVDMRPLSLRKRMAERAAAGS